MNKRCSAVLLNKSKEKDPGSFTIPCDIRQFHINNALADLGASITLMSYTMYEKLGLGEPKPTRMSLELADRSIQYPSGIIENVLIKVDKFVLLVDFVILDMPEDSRVPIILGRPFLATSRALIDVFNKKITLRIGDDEELLANYKSNSFLLKGLKKSINQSNLESYESLGNKSDNDSDLEKLIWRIDSFNMSYLVAQKTARPDGVESEHLYSASANEIDEKKPELKILPHHLEYAYLHGDKSFLIIISSKLSEKEKMLLLQILMEDDFKPVIQPQRRLNPKVKDVVKNKIVKLLDSRLIYLISDSSWVSPIYVVPKKGGMTVVLNDDNELTPRFFQIPITHEDQEKTTFTCPYGTFSYRQMPFGLCNAPATFQRCMTAIFHDMVKDFMEVFMDDFSMFGAENLAAYHLSRLENLNWLVFTKEEIADEFPDEHLMVLKAKPNDDEPWLCPDNVMRRFVAGSEILKILTHCHSGPTRGHHSASITGRKFYESGFFWPSIFKDAKDYAMRCDACQRSGNISSRNEMPQNNIQIELTRTAASTRKELRNDMTLGFEGIKTLELETRLKKYYDGHIDTDAKEVVKFDTT
ncbi:DNA-directed DNA polymerase [Tanacetum coccineum]